MGFIFNGNISGDSCIRGFSCFFRRLGCERKNKQHPAAKTSGAVYVCLFPFYQEVE